MVLLDRAVDVLAEQDHTLLVTWVLGLLEGLLLVAAWAFAVNKIWCALGGSGAKASGRTHGRDAGAHMFPATMIPLFVTSLPLSWL